MPWYRGDLHVHTDRSSGGEMGPVELGAAARAAGLDFLAVTEHRLAATPEALRQLANAGLTVIPGQEVTTETGHWLAVGLPPGRVVDWRYGARHGRITAETTAVREEGGLCVAAHPHAPYPNGTLGYPLDLFDVVEVWNGQWTSDLPWNADNEAALAEWGRGLTIGIHSGRWLPAVGNSDVHHRGQIGTPLTVVHAGERTAASILAAISAGHSWIAGSAAVELSFEAVTGDRAAGVGEVLDTGGEPVVVRAAVRGMPSGTVSFHTERGRMHHQALPTEWRTTAAESAFVRAEVRHPNGHMAALTNPILLT